MKSMTVGLAALAATMVLGVAVPPAQAGKSQRECWAYYNDAWEKMKNGNHKGYQNQMAKYNACMNHAWEGPVPKKKKHM
jgi:hypothetical protein